MSNQLNTERDWGIYECDSSRHVVPQNDAMDHVLSPACKCNPQPDSEDETIIVHNALDRREQYEGKLQ